MGETGVGKELVARQVHALSPREGKPLVYVNCAALPENIAESELFGHTRGAFSGADSNRAGKFEIADGGTLFLDEVGELPLSIQAKLLRALQSGEIQRVGSDRHIQVDVRIVAATNRDLQTEVSNGRFRADLYHRLAVYPIYVPPLRERNEDVLLLAGYFLEANQRGLGVRRLRLSGDSKRALVNYNWPGNVRELNHLLSRGALKAIMEQGRETGSATIHPAHLDIVADKALPGATLPAMDSPDPVPDEIISLKEATDQFQRSLIIKRLAAHRDNRAAVAREFGLDRGNFYRLLRRLEL
jgi:anaerobic nitric oxide reductase transcription regulator